MRIVFAILLFLTACVPSQSVNEAPEPVLPIAEGDRLRVTHDARCCTSPSIGIVQSLSRDSVVLQSAEGRARLAIARSNIFKIQRWNARDTHMLRGAGIGLLVGAAVGALIGSMSSDTDWRPVYEAVNSEIGGLIGLLLGVAVGSRIGGWETIP